MSDRNKFTKCIRTKRKIKHFDLFPVKYFAHSFGIPLNNFHAEVISYMISDNIYTQ